jgi:hypothetical protein
MGAGRESRNIFFYIRNRKWKIAFENIKLLFVIPQHSTIAHKHYSTEMQRMVIKDTFKTPFNRAIGCKVFGHKWSSDEDDKKYEFGGNYYCWKCSRWETKQSFRQNKIDSILK